MCIIIDALSSNSSGADDIFMPHFGLIFIEYLNKPGGMTHGRLSATQLKGREFDSRLGYKYTWLVLEPVFTSSPFQFRI